MTKTKIAALAMIVIWPIAMFLGKTYGGVLHVALVGSLFMWFMEWQDTVAQTRKRPTKARRYG